MIFFGKVNIKMGKNFIIADFSLSPGPVSEYGMTFFHRDRLSFPHRRESTKKASISLWIPAGAGIACPPLPRGQALAKARDGVVKLFNWQL